MKQCPIDFFDPEVQHLAASAGCRLYRMQNDTGEGLISEYPILSGIDLFYNDFHMKDGQNQNKRPMPDTIEINHCREGRFECEFQNGDYQYIGAGDLSIHRLSHTTRQTRFPLAHYHGISITIDLPRAQQTLSSLEAIMGDLDIHLEAIAERFCREESCYVLRSNREVAHIFSELYAAPPERMAHYLKAKVLELLMLLNDLPQESFSEKRQFFFRSQVTAVRAIHDAMIQDLSHHYTLAELSRQFGIAQTSMKLCFKAVYGSSIYQYMKTYRMQTARVLLQDTSRSVTEIAATLGYDNPSKFSEAFKKEYGISPTLFRNSPSELDVS